MVSLSDLGSIWAALAATFALVVPVYLYIIERRAQQEKAAAAAVVQRFEAAAAARAANASRQLALLERLLEQYTDVQAAAVALASFKKQHPDGELWAVLTGQQPGGAANQQAQPRQLQDDVNDMISKCARAKDWWARFYAAVRDDKLPPRFGKAALGAPIDLIDHANREAAGGTGGEKWRFRSNNFRELVEPYDIANSYKMGNHRPPSGGSVKYMAKRPSIFEQLQDIEVAAQRAAGATTYQSSLVWAEAANLAVISTNPMSSDPPALPVQLAPLADEMLPPVI